MSPGIPAFTNPESPHRNLCQSPTPGRKPKKILGITDHFPFRAKQEWVFRSCGEVSGQRFLDQSLPALLRNSGARPGQRAPDRSSERNFALRGDRMRIPLSLFFIRTLVGHTLSHQCR